MFQKNKGWNSHPFIFSVLLILFPVFQFFQVICYYIPFLFLFFLGCFLPGILQKIHIPAYSRVFRKINTRSAGDRLPGSLLISCASAGLRSKTGHDRLEYVMPGDYLSYLVTW